MWLVVCQFCRGRMFAHSAEVNEADFILIRFIVLAGRTVMRPVKDNYRIAPDDCRLHRIQSVSSTALAQTLAFSLF